MKVFLDGEQRTFSERNAFIEAHHLPEIFSIRMFEPKDYTGLAAIDQAGAEMNALRQGVFDAIPADLKRAELLDIADRLQTTFHAGLYAINVVIGLRVEEVEYAVAGFGDVIRNWVYALISSGNSTNRPTFYQVYGDWFNSSVRLSQQIYIYPHQGKSWRIQIVNHAYGRAGMRIDSGQAVYYVQDGAYVCPAEGYMSNLLKETAEKISAALNTHAH